MKTLRVALVGNPNAGKSTLFNALTGAQQHVGNWPGKTVAKKVGFRTYGDYRLEVVDLPGAYSLSAYTFEELITRNYILDERPDVVVVVIDAANLERNLYLAVQVLELGAPTVIVLNMMDAATARGYRIDLDGLAEALQAPLVTTVARQGQGLDRLLEMLTAVAAQQIDSDYA